MIALIGGGLVSLLLFLYELLGVKSLFYAWFILIIIMLAINILYTKVFIKLFNKLTPIHEGELYDKAILLSKSLGYEIKQISIMDASKRSSRLNAFFSGFGKFKSIVLYDQLTFIRRPGNGATANVGHRERSHLSYILLGGSRWRWCHRCRCDEGVGCIKAASGQENCHVEDSMIVGMHSEFYLSVDNDIHFPNL